MSDNQFTSDPNVFPRGRHEFYIRRSDFANHFEVRLCQVNPRAGDERFVATNITYTRHEPGQHAGPPVLTLDVDEAQHVLDELWRCGLRPTNVINDASKSAAMESHIVDLQKIAHRLVGTVAGIAEKHAP